MADTVPDPSSSGKGEVVASQGPVTAFGDSEQKNAMDWRNLFLASNDQSLKFFLPQMVNGKALVKSIDDVFEGVHQWRNFLVAQFLGWVPNFSQFQRLVNMLWGKEGYQI
ncbi:uncharacterized protein LOC111289928 [Durio zibethinus]|uniref:Uncharacterized protein LOC111289928 n=1 Tax=Durio zibethinus TaxID=66656 RepID=A0A6P5Y9F2_DURZI|nr:uncharacterized protein LOC111289928 [Durio zibethinus]